LGFGEEEGAEHRRHRLAGRRRAPSGSQVLWVAAVVRPRAGKSIEAGKMQSSSVSKCSSALLVSVKLNTALLLRYVVLFGNR
jgi:hypothetical protein